MGCGPGKNAIDANVAKIKLQDYTFDESPNDLDNVGYVFAIDRNKSITPIINLNLRPIQGSIEIVKKTSTKDISFGAILGFLGLSSLNMTSNDSIDNDRKITTTFSFSSPLINRGFLVTLDSAIDLNKAAIKRSIIDQHLENARIYVILETIKTKNLIYDFKKSNIGDAKLSANLQKIASINPNAKWDAGTTSSLDYDSDKELTVFYKLFQIDVLSGITGTIEIQRGSLVNTPELPK